MEIKPPTNNLYTAISRTISSASQNSLAGAPPVDWKVSQLIQAIITKITDKQLFLNIQGVKANTPKPTGLDLHVGDTLKLQIEQLKPMPQFRIVRFQPTPNLNVINTAAKSVNPEQISILPMLKNISFVANRPALHPSPLSAETNMAVRNLFKQIPSVFNLKTAPQVKEHLQNSGLFVENKIKNEILSAIQHVHVNKISSSKANLNIKPLLERDLSVQLHRIADLIRAQLTPTKTDNNKTHTPTNTNTNPRQQPSRLTTNQATLQNITQREEAMQTFLRQIESSLTHMQQTQLQTLNESQAGRPVWLMELPVKDGQNIDLFELRIEQDETSQTGDTDAKKIWNVTLSFNLEGLGKIKAHITMQDDLISTQFYSDKAETLNLFQENFDLLRNRLSYNGLNVGKIKCIHANLEVDIQTNNRFPMDESYE